MSLSRTSSLALPAKSQTFTISSSRFKDTFVPQLDDTTNRPLHKATTRCEPVVARATILSRCLPDKPTVIDKLESSLIAEQEELRQISDEQEKHLTNKKCKCELLSLSTSQIQTSRHSTRYYSTGDCRGKRKSPADHATWLYDAICHSTPSFEDLHERKRKWQKFRHCTFGVYLCRKCFCHVYGISISKFQKCRRAVEDAKALHGNNTVLTETLTSFVKRTRFETIGATILRCFCDRLATECEVMPHMMEVGDVATATFDVNDESNMQHNETRYYPACYTFKSMYLEYSEEVRTKFVSAPAPYTYQHFKDTMQKRYPLCKTLPKGSVVFKCVVCAGLRAEFDGCTDERVKLVCLHYMKSHKQRFKASRQNYADTIAYSLHNPAILMSNIIDGMDQQKCCSPRIPCSRADLPKNCQLKFHVIGSLVHGCKMFAFCLVSSKWAQAGPQLTVTVIIKTLRRCVDLNGFLPASYHLQLDNPSGENKNHDVLAMMGLLVDWTVFEDTVLEFGVTGHTHFDIDQAFSRLSVSLSLGHLTVADFFERIRNGFTHYNAVTEAILCNELLNWHMASSPHLHEFSGISRPLLFKLSKGACGNVVVHYKSHCGKQQWKGKPRAILPCCFCIAQHVPCHPLYTGMPNTWHAALCRTPTLL